MIARGALADVELLSDRIVVESLGDQLQHFVFAGRELIERRTSKSGGPGRRRRQKIVERLDKLLPRRLGIQEHMVAALKRDKPRAGNEPGDRPALLERDY